MDPSAECQDKEVLMLAYSRINTLTDENHWVYSRWTPQTICHYSSLNLHSRTNKWLSNAKGRTLPVDVRSRCLHKVSQDFARLVVSVDTWEGQVEKATLGPRTTLLDQASGIGWLWTVAIKAKKFNF